MSFLRLNHFSQCEEVLSSRVIMLYRSCRTYHTLNKNDNIMKSERQKLERLNAVSTKLYRILLRECREFLTSCRTKKENRYMLLQRPLDPRDWGHAKLLSSISSSSAFFFTANLDSDFKQKRKPNHVEVLKFLEQSRRINKMKQDNPSRFQKDTSSMNSIYVNYSDIINAIRTMFRAPLLNSSDGSEAVRFKKILENHQRAIDSIPIIRYQSLLNWNENTKATYDSKRGLVVIATSEKIGKNVPSTQNKPHELLSPNQNTKKVSHRYAYRIRIENVSHLAPESSDTSYQLLGRHWVIQKVPGSGTSSSDCVLSNEEPLVISAPQNGAVGHFPVIHPGETFEYMSGCELSFPSGDNLSEKVSHNGNMSGYFFMANVSPDTPSAMLGDNVDALHLFDNFDPDTDSDVDAEDEKSEAIFKLPVGPFGLN